MFGHSCLICLPILSVVCNFLSLSDVFNSTMLDSHCANEFRYIVCLNVSLITEIKKKKGGLVQKVLANAGWESTHAALSIWVERLFLLSLDQKGATLLWHLDPHFWYWSGYWIFDFFVIWTDLDAALQKLVELSLWFWREHCVALPLCSNFVGIWCLLVSHKLTIFLAC